VAAGKQEGGEGDRPLAWGLRSLGGGIAKPESDEYGMNKGKRASGSKKEANAARGKEHVEGKA